MLAVGFDFGPGLLSPLELQDKPLFRCQITFITSKKVPDWKILDKPMDPGLQNFLDPLDFT